MIGQPTVSFIICNYNGKDYLHTLVESLRGLDYPKQLIEIVVVDNASTDGSREYLEQDQADIKLIANPANYGFARASNQGAEAAGGEWLAFINNDMRLEPDWVRKLLEALSQQREDVVCAGGKILSWDGSRVDFIGGSMAFNGHAFQKHFGERVEAVEQPREVQETLFACGGAMLIRRDVFLQVGGFDEDYFAYFEDVDLGWRLWLMGYKVVFVPQAVVYHHHFGTTRKFAESKHLFLCERNALFNIYKNYSEENLKQILPAALMLLIHKAFQFTPIDPSSFSPAQSGTTPNSEGAQEIAEASGLSQFLHVLGEKGLGGTVNKALSSLAIGELKRSGIYPISESGLAILSAVPAFVSHLDGLAEKRCRVQARRKLKDEALFPLFADPFSAVGDTPALRKVVSTLSEIFDITKLFSS